MAQTCKLETCSRVQTCKLANLLWCKLANLQSCSLMLGFHATRKLQAWGCKRVSRFFYARASLQVSKFADIASLQVCTQEQVCKFAKLWTKQVCKFASLHTEQVCKLAPAASLQVFKFWETKFRRYPWLASKFCLPKLANSKTCEIKSWSKYIPPPCKLANLQILLKI